MRRMFKSKIHRATCTHADLHYEGSVTIDLDLLEASDIIQYEEVHIWNVTNGARIVTYALEGQRGSGVVCINGAAARHFAPGDKVIIATFTDVEERAARTHQPTVVFVDGENRQVHKGRAEVAGPQMPPRMYPAQA